jgi:hypothetical protein
MMIHLCRVSTVAKSIKILESYIYWCCSPSSSSHKAEVSIFATEDLAFLFLNVLYIIFRSVKFCIEWYRIVWIMREKRFVTWSGWGQCSHRKGEAMMTFLSITQEGLDQSFSSSSLSPGIDKTVLCICQNWAIYGCPTVPHLTVSSLIS